MRLRKKKKNKNHLVKIKINLKQIIREIKKRQNIKKKINIVI